LRFIGHNLEKVTAIQFSGTDAVVEQKDFKQHSSDLILLVVPTKAEKGFVTLKTADGDIVSKTQLNLKVASSITSMTPQARPGENITINGNYLNWVNKITFARDKVVTTFVSKSINQIVVTVPADAQTGPLVLSYQGTDSSFVQSTDTLKVTLPVATAISPNPVKHADNITITGTNLDLVKKVIFSGVATPVTTFVSQSATQIVVKVPGGTTKGKVTLEAASGAQTMSADLDVMMPVITAMTPGSVDIGGNLTITGTNLDLVTSVAFTGVPDAVTTFVSKSATQLVVKVPAGAAKGKLTFAVMNSTLTVKSATDLEINGVTVAPLIIFDDAVTTGWTSSGWIGGGWGGTSDRNNTTVARDGTKSIKIDYVGGYGSPFQLGHDATAAGINIAPYKTLKLSIYGAPGSAGKSITIGINGVNGKYNINVEEGKWTDYSIPLSTLTSASNLKEIWIQEYSGTGGFTIYADAIGLY
jgi:hypothetical protein